MKTIEKFSVDRDKDSLEICSDIKNYIDDFIRQNTFINFFEKYSILLNCPKNVLELKTKQL